MYGVHDDAASAHVHLEEGATTKHRRETESDRQDTRDIEGEVSVPRIWHEDQPVRSGKAIIATVVLHNIAVSAGEIEPDEQNSPEDELEPEMEPEGQEKDQETRFRTIRFRTRPSDLLNQSCLCPAFAYPHCARASKV